MSEELERFKRDLLKSAKQMRSGEAARVTRVKVPEAAEARSRTGLSQEQFARLLGVSARTLQDWEQGRREPTGAAKTLLRVAYEHPEAETRALMQNKLLHRTLDPVACPLPRQSPASSAAERHR
jgi:putative transcriptional regulator